MGILGKSGLLCKGSAPCWRHCHFRCRL